MDRDRQGRNKGCNICVKLNTCKFVEANSAFVKSMDGMFKHSGWNNLDLLFLSDKKDCMYFEEIHYKTMLMDLKSVITLDRKESNGDGYFDRKVAYSDFKKLIVGLWSNCDADDVLKNLKPKAAKKYRDLRNQYEKRTKVYMIDKGWWY